MLHCSPMHKTISIATRQREELVDITDEVSTLVRASGVQQGICSVYAQGATAAIMIQENWDRSVPVDMVNLLKKMIPRGIWEHDQQDGNGDAHLKAGLVGPSETIPVIDGKLALSTWQGIFFCEFDGPRSERRIVCTVLRDEE
jgi:secondary thiamine-phosphate synthase enzyme